MISKELREGQKEFGEDIARLVNTLLLTIVYILGIGVTFFFARLSGKRFLYQKGESEKTTYWEELNIGTRQKEEYYRQF